MTHVPTVHVPLDSFTGPTFRGCFNICHVNIVTAGINSEAIHVHTIMVAAGTT